MVRRRLASEFEPALSVVSAADHDAEVERLREALRVIATAAERVPDWRAMVEVARAALDGTEK